MSPNRQEIVASELQLDGELRQQISLLTPKARSEQLHPIILNVCSGRWVTAAQLSELLERDLPRLMRSHISVLVADGKLERRHRETHHRDQAYRTRQLSMED